MIQINNGFDVRYYLTESGEVYDNAKGCYIKPNKEHIFNLRTVEGKYKKKSLKTLYNALYGKNYCIDNVENLENEEWKEIKGTNGNYYCSNEGRIKSMLGYESVILKNYRDINYNRVTLMIDGKKNCKLVSNIVASTFYGEKEGCEVHHCNGISTDDRLCNLRYVTKEEHRKIHSKKERKNGS